MNWLPINPLIVRALQVAEVRLGIEELSRRLNAPADLIRAWRMGHATMPERKWFKLIDILMDIDPDWDKDAKS